MSPWNSYKKHKGKLFDIGIDNNFFGYDTKSTDHTHTKNRQVGLYLTEKLLHSKGNNKKKDNLQNGKKIVSNDEADKA